MTNRAATASRENPPSGWGALLLVIIAICYYGFYWRAGLMLSGEEGVVAVVAQRLNAGARPIADTFLGYNVGWFYPIAWLFKVAGPNYLLLRAYFFLLGILSGLAAYLTISLVSRKHLLAVGTGLLIILMPGVIGRNYMGLLGNLGVLTILGTFVIQCQKRTNQLLWMMASGCAISLTWLIRIDLGFFQTILFLLTAILFLLKPQQGFLRRLGRVAASIVILSACFCTIQGPVYYDAVRRDFYFQFAKQYETWPCVIRDGTKQLLHHFAHQSDSSIATSSPASTTSPLPSPTSTEEEKATASYNNFCLKRPPLVDILDAPEFKERIFALLIYLPIPVSLLFIGWGMFLTLGSLFFRNEELWKKGAALLVSTGGALTLFPQYFFWRPDMVHLGEFMIPFMVALVIGISFVTCAWRKSSLASRSLLLILTLPAVVDLGTYAFKGWQSDGAGSIAASRRRHLDFAASNGVRVKLNPEELSRATLLRDTILSYSKAGDYVVCYPYFPMVNFMTDRPSYDYNLYADNALPPEKFFNQAKANIERYHPAVIVIGTGKVNDTEASRFQNWAAKTYGYIREHFTLVASDKEVEIYSRK